MQEKLENWLLYIDKKQKFTNFHVKLMKKTNPAICVLTIRKFAWDIYIKSCDSK